MGCSSAIAALAGSRFNGVAFGNPEEEPNQEILLTVFLRGGIDALNLIPPIGGSDRGVYESSRPSLSVPINSAIQLDNTAFGLHPAAASLHDLYTNNDLAIIHAVGMHDDTRSHFDAMNYMEMGTPGQGSTTTGWITRHLASAPNLPSEILMPALAVGHYSPISYLGSSEVLSLNDPYRFSLRNGPWRYQDAQRVAMREMYAADTSWIHQAGLQTLNAADLIEVSNLENYIPPTGITYPDSEFGEHLKIVAQLIKLQVGLRTITVDLGGWDTHEDQGDGDGGYYAALLQTLSDGLYALYDDLTTSGSYSNRLTVVVQSEFGRRLTENGDSGTDHGHGGTMLVLGGNVNGGLHGTWPGLAPGQLFEDMDLEVTTDYRQILSEILIRRLENPNLETVFPGFCDYNPLGIVQGVDLTPNCGVPTAVSSLETKTAGSHSATKALTVAGAGLAATAGLIALRNRDTT